MVACNNSDLFVAKWLDKSKTSDWFPDRLLGVLYRGSDFVNGMASWRYSCFYREMVDSSSV